LFLADVNGGKGSKPMAEKNKKPGAGEGTPADLSELADVRDERRRQTVDEQRRTSEQDETTRRRERARTMRDKNRSRMLR
jgi:hypothetical protein